MEKQDLRVTKTLRQIETTLLTLLETMPFSQIKVEQLCREAMINRSTFYVHYADKYDLLERTLGKLLTEFENQADVAFVNATPKTIDHLSYQRSFQQLLTYLSRQKRTYAVLWSADLGRDLFGEMTELVFQNMLRHLELGQLSPEQQSYARLYTRLFSTNMMTMVRWWLCQQEITMEQLQQIMADNMSLGMFTAFRKYVGS